MWVDIPIKAEFSSKMVHSLSQDGNGPVSSSEIKFVLTRLGVDFSDEELGEMIQESPDLDHENTSFISGGRYKWRSTCQL